MTKNNKLVYIITVVDEDNVPKEVRSLDLPAEALPACSGVAKAELQIVRGEGGYVNTKPNVILVTHHTNNEWNDVFGKLSGVITADGGSTSHAAKNSRKLNIPSLVGATGVMDMLSSYNGQKVTFDSFNRKIYFGDVPTKTIEIPLTIWMEDLKALSNQDIERHELEKSWEEKTLGRPEIFISLFDGHWRRRSAKYVPFELDYYWRAWDKLAEYLNERYVVRRPWVLPSIERSIRRSALLQKIYDYEPTTIYDFLSQLHGVDLDDFEALFDLRWKGFDSYIDYLRDVKELNVNNAEQVIEGLVNTFMWMHFAFYLNAVVDRNYSFPQLQYLSPEVQEAFRDAAVKELPAAVKRDLSREKDMEIYAMMERIDLMRYFAAYSLVRKT